MEKFHSDEWVKISRTEKDHILKVSDYNRDAWADGEIYSERRGFWYRVPVLFHKTSGGWFKPKKCL